MNKLMLKNNYPVFSVCHTYASICSTEYSAAHTNLQFNWRANKTTTTKKYAHKIEKKIKETFKKSNKHRGNKSNRWNGKCITILVAKTIETVSESNQINACFFFNYLFLSFSRSTSRYCSTKTNFSVSCCFL